MTDASRLRFAGGAAVLACIVAVGTHDEAPRGAPTPPPAAQAPEAVAARGAGTPPSPAAPPEAPRAAPRFDVVRVSARGMVVVAGRAVPGAEVALHDGGREIGRARADARGEWVILPPEPLTAGLRELSLRARSPAGEDQPGPDSFFVAGPDPARAEIAHAAAPGTGTGAGAGAARAAEAPPTLPPPLGAGAPPDSSQRDRAPASGPEVVDHGMGSTMHFAGTAPHATRPRLHADDRHPDDATAEEAGRQSLPPTAPPGPGRHILRVDQIALRGRGGARGAVAGRIEVVFQREALPPGASPAGEVVVQPGHNLWRIARDAYGQGRRYTAIVRANREKIRSPARIYPGQVFSLPEPP